MKILAEIDTGMGSKWQLVCCDDNFYAYGTEEEFKSFFGVPVDQCGTKEEVLEHCKLISELCKEYIDKYKEEMKKSDNPKGWQTLIEYEQIQFEMLTAFSKVLES